MSIRVGKSAFTPNVHANAFAENGDQGLVPSQATAGGNPLTTTLLGASLSAAFYGVVWSISWGPLQRYFLGHPIAIAATVLFWFAVGVLISKWLRVVTQANQLAAIRDEDLLPASSSSTPANRWLEENDARHVAQGWLAEITKLPREVRSSQLVGRLHELLTRQAQRGSTKHLADDLRELSGRDADAAHDSLGLVRIIIWAIPMLGFLGTVIGITQTLGGLDFSNGAAAVENLKSGLYVAFDTTAIGLVLSVLAIFLQFPIERSEQRLLAVIDARVGHLLSASLPSDDASDNQTALIADLCRGVQAAVAESLENQAKLWRETIDEAQQYWQRVHEANANQIAEAIETTLIPAFANHASSMDQSAIRSADHLERQWQLMQETLRQHWQTLVTQQQSMAQQFEALADTQRGTESILALQQTLDANLQRLHATNATIERSVSAAAGDGMAEAMRFLARAVDVLAERLPDRELIQAASRRAA